MTPERARELLPIIQAFSEGKPVYQVIKSVYGELSYVKLGRNIQFNHGTYTLEIPEVVAALPENSAILGSPDCSGWHFRNPLAEEVKEILANPEKYGAVVMKLSDVLDAVKNKES